MTKTPCPSMNAMENKACQTLLERLRAGQGKGGGKSSDGKGKVEGKGKNKTDNKDKGAGNGKGKNTKGWWDCLVERCIKHQGGQPCWSHPCIDICQICEVLQAAAAANTTRSGSENEVRTKLCANMLLLLPLFLSSSLP